MWAELGGIAYTTFRSLAEHPDVIALIEREVAQQNTNLARVEQIKKVHLLPKELDHDDGEVTATMKVRRSKVQDIYAGPNRGPLRVIFWNNFLGKFSKSIERLD